MTILFNCTYTLTFTTSSCHTADEMMTFRRAGQPSPPPSPLTVPEEASTKDESKIAKVCNGQEEMGNFMDALMQSTLEKIGVDQRMANLAPSQQMIIAERIHKAKEAFLAKLLSETEKMSGDKVIQFTLGNCNSFLLSFSFGAFKNE